MLAQDAEFYQLRYIKLKTSSCVVFRLLPGTNFPMEHAAKLTKFLILNFFTLFLFSDAYLYNLALYISTVFLQYLLHIGASLVVCIHGTPY